MVRLFVALRPPPAIRDLLADAMDGVPQARWQDDDQLHLTLRFIGEVDRPVAEDIAAALGQVRAPAPMVRISGVGTFDRKGRVDTLWAGVTPHDALARLPGSAGRAPEIEGWRAVHAGLSSEPFTMGHLVLYQSHLGHGGASYEPVMRWPLETGG
ncbi:RNA 2',3'-cyclic phosphodiesterase [Sphingomonas parapaucimobilis]|uniref:RNA 2',3'-cyclic phosphodiesterase n=1 Tax=Sphingomonas parapaucimobilis NBRC 15100 TaxID=1219049 RepID=A0A0A1W638_9SPHN|nr:RNA 2',3'-cyclic phosphodiesterase [Sphingomonas parapaucimobilis]GAM00652.1 putative 2'-5' RNA ligase [Sphingomonas parapaucimobilis NBRC 15100]